MMRLLLALLCAFSYSASLSAQDIDQGLVAHWLMNDEEEIEDQSPTGLDGAFGGGALTEDRFGVEDEAVFFDGQFDYAVFEDALDDITTANDASFTISMWHRTADFIPNLSPLMCKYSHSLCGEAERQWALLIAANEGIRFYYAPTPDNANYRSVSTLNPVAQDLETWYHVLVTYDGSTDENDGQDRVQIYLDNVLQADTLNFSIGELGETIHDGEAPIALMSYVSIDGDACGEFHAPGALDDIRIYDRVVTPAEVELLYTEGAVGLSEHLSEALDIAPTLISDGQLTMHSTERFDELQVEISSAGGRLVYSHMLSVQNGTQTVDVTGLAKGLYVVEMSTSDGARTIERVVIE